MAPTSAASQHDQTDDRAALLAAWESAQKLDPHTRDFARVEAARYRFATTYFPFDGELDVLDVRVAPASDPTGRRHGTVEVTLRGVPNDFYERHFEGVVRWQETNYLVRSGDGDWQLLADFQTADDPQRLGYYVVAGLSLLIVYLLIQRRVARGP